MNNSKDKISMLEFKSHLILSSYKRLLPWIYLFKNMSLMKAFSIANIKRDHKNLMFFYSEFKHIKSTLEKNGKNVDFYIIKNIIVNQKHKVRKYVNRSHGNVGISKRRLSCVIIQLQYIQKIVTTKMLN